jgi:hypothetical protein
MVSLAAVRAGQDFLDFAPLVVGVRPVLDPPLAGEQGIEE